jgi:hypothetical protein
MSRFKASDVAGVNMGSRTADRADSVWHWSEAANGRFLRHRPKRSERRLKDEKLYQGHGPLPKSQGVPEGPQRNNHVARHATRN